MARRSDPGDQCAAPAAAPPASRRDGLRHLLAWPLLALWQQVVAAGRPLSAAAPHPAGAEPAARDTSAEPLTDWALLRPDGWDVWQPLRDQGWPDPAPDPDPDSRMAWDDTDPAHAALARVLRRHRDAAPPAPFAQGRQARLAGFLLPLPPDAASGVAQALLVPRFGAGVYTPPPPANQVVRLRWGPGAQAWAAGDAPSGTDPWAMAAVSAQGVLRAWPSDSPLGRSAWLIEPAQLARYRPTA